jgi:hypothetical protein
LHLAVEAGSLFDDGMRRFFRHINHLPKRLVDYASAPDGSIEGL